MAEYPYSKSFSFAEIVHGRDSSVRVTDDGLLFAVDLVMVVTGKNCNHSNECLRQIDKDIFKQAKFIERQIHKRGGYTTRLIKFQDAIELIMVLPGKTAKHIRKQFADIIVRYLDGDRSLCSEVEANKTIGKAKSYSKFASNGMKKIEHDDAKKALEIPQTNYVYATKSLAFPGLVKIGNTGNLAQRLSGLNVSCAPAPHVIVAVAPTFDMNRDEKAAHMFFSNSRREGEFFELSDEVVISYFTTHITTQYNAELKQKTADLQGLSI